MNVGNFGNTLAMSVIFFFICSKFDLDFKNADKNSEKRFCFWDNCISIGCYKYCLLRAEYLSRAVNVLTNGLKVLHFTKSNFSKLSWLHSDQSIWQRCRRSDFNSVWVRLPCCFSKVTLKRYFFYTYLTAFLEGHNFRKTLAMSVISFFEYVQNLI